MASPITPYRQQFFDNNGNPLASGFVYTYVPGTNTPKTTYQNYAGTITNTNPIVLDAGGGCVMLGTGEYLITVTDALGNQISSGVSGLPEVTDLVDNSSSGTPLTLGYLNLTNLAVSGLATAPTPTTGDNSTKVATTQFVQNTLPTTTVTLPVYGLTLSYGSTSSYGIAVGGAMSNDASTMMTLGSALTKTFSNWSSGTGNGSLDTGSITNSTWYHVYLIYDPTTKVTDILCSTSATGPTMPTGYTKKTRIGALYINSSGVLMNFVQYQNEFLYTASVQDMAINPPDTSAHLVTMTVPTGLQVYALFRGNLNTTNASNVSVLFTSPDESDQAPGQTLNSLYVDVATGGSTSGESAEFALRTSTSGQIRYRSGLATGTIGINAWTKGFLYPRGLI